MKGKVRLFSILTPLLLAMILGSCTPRATEAQEEAPLVKEMGVSLQSLDRLIQTLESPEKRETLLKQLKALQELQTLQPTKEAPEKKPPNLVERAIIGYSAISGRISDSLEYLIEGIRGLPEGLERARTYLSAQRNRAVVYRTTAVLGIGILLALAVFFLMRRVSSALSRGVFRGREGTARDKAYTLVLEMIIRVSPYVGLLGGAFLVFNLLGIRGLPYRFAMLILLVLVQYEVVFSVLRILLSPHDSKTRILPLAEETSAYSWIWAKRFLNLWVLYYFVTESLVLLKAGPPMVAFVRGVLIVLFPVFITVLLLQLKKTDLSRGKPPGDLHPWKKVLAFGLRVWPLGVGALVWLISIFMISGYNIGVTFLAFALLKTVVALGILWGLLYLVERLFGRLFNLGMEMKARFPELEEKTNRYIGSLRAIVRGILVAVGIGAIVEFWGLKASWFVTSELGSNILSRCVAIAITVGLALVVIDLSGFVTRQLLRPRTDADGNPIEPGRKAKTLLPLVHWVVMVAAAFIGGVTVMSQLGVNITPILAGAGIVGLAVGFGAQSLVKDFINGLFLLFEDSVAVGDVVVIHGTGGLVEAVTLRTIKMRDLAGNLHVVPNGSVDMITNMTKEYSRYVFDIGVAYREDVDEVMAVLREIGESLQRDPEYGDDIVEPFEILGVDKFDDSAVIIKARITTRPIKQWRVAREFNRRMKKTFDERGIEIPFPHRTVYWGEPKTGQAPPLSIHMSGQGLSRAEELA